MAWRTVLAGAGFATTALAAALVGPPAVAGLGAHPYFGVRDVAVSGVARLPPAEVARAAGIVPGMSIWDVDVAAAAARLGAHPWVRSARVRRELPRRVVLEVREHRPVAILALGDRRDALWYVAAHGRIIAPVAPTEPHDYPFVTGLRATDLAPGETAGPRALRRALELLRVAARDRRLESVSEIAVDPADGLLTLLLVRPAVPIEVGSGRFADRLARLPEVLALWAGREREMAALSLAFADEIIVRTRAPEAAPRAHRAT